MYPKVKVGGVECTVIAWIWARTVTCPNPACGGTMPLVRSFWLGKKKGKQRYVIPVPDDKRIRFEIGGPDGVPRDGTVGRSGAVCLLCGTPVPLGYVRDEGKAGRIGAQLMAIAAEGPRQRYYVAPNADHEKIAEVSRPEDVADAELPQQALSFRVQSYGMKTWSALFTNRQLTALATFSDLVHATHNKIMEDADEIGYADAVVTYLAFAVDRLADYSSNLSTWMPDPKNEGLRNTFARHAIPMIWDFAEANVFSESSGNVYNHAVGVARVLDALPANVPGEVHQADAAMRPSSGLLCATDPPYYDNVGYSSLFDFFYVWLRRSLAGIAPDLTGTVLTPKAEELVAEPFRHGGVGAAGKFFEEGFERTFKHICESTPGSYPITAYYAFKQAEHDLDGGHASTGWETLLEGMLRAGWTVTATWPVRTERTGRSIGVRTNALASSVVLACRPRRTDAASIDRRGLIKALREELPKALRKLEQGKVAPVDLRQAAIGPGMAVFSRYSRVNEPDGSRMRVRAALSLINRVLDDSLSQFEGNVSADTRFCAEWFKQFGFDEGPFGTAETLSKGIDTSISGLERSGVLKSRAGKVKLLHVTELPDEYDPATDDRTSEWEICLHLAKALQNRGTDAAARIMASARDVPGIDLDDVKELAYLLYSIAEKKPWAETALLFNNLGTSWTDIEDASRKVTPATAGSGQGAFTLEFGSDDDGDE